MKKSRILVSLMLVLTLVFFTGCGNDEDTAVDDNSDSQVTEQDAGEPEQPPKENATENSGDSQDNQQMNKEEKVTLYIGTIEAGYQEVDVEMDSRFVYGHNFDEHLLAALEKETGWNLELANPIEDVEGGKTVQFTEQSGFVVGPPEKQNEKYFVYDNISFTQNMLDSIQKTFDMNLTDGNPQRSLNLYFSIVDKPIKVENMTIPTDKPWNQARALNFG